MKKILALSLAFAGFAFAASAQTDRVVQSAPDNGQIRTRGGNPMRMQNEQMMKDLNLTDVQKEQMKKNMQEMRAKMEDLRNNTTLSEDDKRTQMKSLRDEQKAKMDALLTPEQKEKWEAARKKMMEERKNNPGGFGDRGPKPTDSNTKPADSNIQTQ